MSLDMVYWLFSILLAGYVMPQFVCFSCYSSLYLFIVPNTALCYLGYVYFILVHWSLCNLLFALISSGLCSIRYFVLTFCFLVSIRYTLVLLSFLFFLLSVFTIISMSIRYVVLFFYSHFSLQCLYAKFNHLWYLSI